MDNLGTHKPGALYELLNLRRQKDYGVGLPQHGSWLNMAEIELNVLSGQCLNLGKPIVTIKKLK